MRQWKTRVPFHATISTTLALLIVMLFLPACGTQQGTVEGQVLGMFAADQQPRILNGASVQVSGSHGDQSPVLTDSNGKFHLTLPYDNYNILATADGFQPREKSVSLNSSQIETVGFVLVAPGIQQPQSPPPLTPQDRQALSGGSAFTGGSSGGSFLSDPWFWFWMFDRPYYYGFPRIPFVGYGGFGGGRSPILVIDRRTDPLITANQRGYATYRDPAGPAVPGTKPAPQPVNVTTGSKGVTKPSTGGSSGIGGSRGPAPIAPPSNSGVNRAPSTGSKGGSGISGGSGSVTKPAPVAPPSRSYRGGSSRGGSKGRR